MLAALLDPLSGCILPTMTPEEAARFVLSDCQDPVLRAKADREASAMLEESLRDPVFKQQWDANLRRMSDEIDARIAADVYGQLYPSK
jgi:hypothetical protein